MIPPWSVAATTFLPEGLKARRTMLPQSARPTSVRSPCR